MNEEVQKLLDGGKLHPDDAIWIKRLPLEKQLAAALKCVNGAKIFLVPELPKTRMLGSRQNGKWGKSQC